MGTTGRHERRGYPITAYALWGSLGDRDHTRKALERGVSGLRSGSEWTPDYAAGGGIPEPLPALPTTLAPYDTRQSRLAWLALEAMTRALERSRSRWGSDRIGVVIGTSTGGIRSTEEAFGRQQAEGVWPPEFDLQRRHAMQAVLSVIRARTRIEGPSHVLSTACASGGKVFGTAQRWLHLGLVDAMLVGGVDTLCRMTVRGFQSLEVLSSRPCRPFSSQREGINLGEGAAYFLFERTGEGPASLRGVGETNDAYHMSTPHPEGVGARAAMEQALQDAGLDPAEVSHINAHGTGTVLSDAAEARAIAELFGSRVPVVATKGTTGHLLGAAGAMEAAFCILSLEHGFLPASVGALPVDPTLGIDLVTEPRTAPQSVVLSNSFAFGGTNVSVVFGSVP